MAIKANKSFFSNLKPKNSTDAKRFSDADVIFFRLYCTMLFLETSKKRKK